MGRKEIGQQLQQERNERYLNQLGFELTASPKELKRQTLDRTGFCLRRRLIDLKLCKMK